MKTNMPKSSFSMNLPENRSDYSKNWKSLLPTLREEEKIVWKKEKKLISKKRKLNEKLPEKQMEPSKKSNNFKDESSENATTSSSAVAENGVLPKRKKNSDSPLEKTNFVPKPNNSVKNSAPNLTKCLAIDCEFVGVGDDGFDDMVARVSLVNLYGECVYDKFVKPKEDVVDYRTHVSGIRPEDLTNAESLKIIQKEVYDLIHGRILIGHSVKKDLQVLFLSHPKKNLRDTSKFRPFQGIAKTNRPSLKKLANLVLGVSIQEGEHDSITDARVTMQLYRMHRNEWEMNVRRRFKK